MVRIFVLADDHGLDLLEQLVATKPASARHATPALAALNTTATEFQPDDVDLTAVREAAVAAAAAVNSSIKPRIFAVRTGMKVEEVVALMGYPAQAGVTLRDRAAYHARFTVNNLSFGYEGAGDIEFIHQSGDWVVSLITPLPLPRHLESADSALVEIRKGLLSPNIVELRRVAALSREQPLDEITLDLVAWRLRSHLHANELYVIDALRYLCVTLEEIRECALPRHPRAGEQGSDERQAAP